MVTKEQIYAEMCGMRDGSLTLDADPCYAHLLKHKRVAIVGPAKTALGTRQGRLIDSYDLVVRLNDTIDYLPFSGDLADDIGTRTDILYCNQVILRDNILKQQGIHHERFIKVCEDLDIKYFLCTNNGMDYDATGVAQPLCNEEDKDLMSDFRRFMIQHRMNTKLRVVYMISKIVTRWLNGYLGRTGFIAIVDLLSFAIDHLHLTGLTFYHGGGHLFPKGTEELHPLRNRDGTWARSASILGHNSYVELELMKMLVQCFRHKLTLDEPLRALLEAGGRGSSAVPEGPP